jgi:bifunctional enzyme CysN/CysC/sulfate adenylyltransferase subunit 1
MMQHTQSLLQRFVKSWDLNNGESSVRSLVKAYSYRCCGTLTTIVISYIVTGQIVVSLAIGATEMVIKPFIYWCHERVWSRINWGKL